MKKDITFVGLDVHATSIALAVFPPGAEILVEREIPNDPKLIRRTFTRLKAEAEPLRCCYEAGPCGFELYRLLTAMGIPCEVVAPALIPQKPGERIKTDRRDAPAPEVVVLVRKAHLRLHKRYARLVGRGERPQVAVTAVARELCGFVWALMAREAA